MRAICTLERVPQAAHGGEDLVVSQSHGGAAVQNSKFQTDSKALVDHNRVGFVGLGFWCRASSSPPTEITRRISSDFPEFDHYPDRGAAKYWGPILSNGGGRSFEWPEGDEEARIFVYISARHAEFQSMVHSLGARGTPVTAYIHDLDQSKVV